jgi:hypothetical protein
MPDELDRAAEALEDARKHLLRTLVVAAGYVERRAATGDPEAVELSALIAGAFDTMRCVGIDATTTMAERNTR